MSELFETAIVEKRNVLNELRSNNMTVQELRFFSIYLSKINPWNISTRVVRFSIDDFRRIMGFGKLNIGQLRASTDSLLCKLVHVPDEDGRGMRTFQLFKECHLFQDDDKWYVEIDAHDKALPLLFDFKNQYFKYELWNALRLKSPNQVRMYEILKQYENLGKREISVKELKSLLGINESEYSYWQNFKVRVLDSCQDALNENTDICYTYERGKTGKGGKWLSIIFHISKNKNYKDQLSLDEFIQQQPEVIDISFSENVAGSDDEPVDINYGSELLNFLGSTALSNEFSVKQVKVLKDLTLQAVPSHDHLEMCNYLLQLVNKMDIYNPQNRFKYLCKMIEADIN
jgi:plasmid replication initiation protein